MRKTVRVLLLLVPVLLVLGAGGFVVWANTPPAPMAEAVAAMQSDDQVRVEVSGWIAFEPQNVAPRTGFIFYPGGRVAPESYAPALSAVAAQGYLAVIVPMPLNLAVFAPERALDVIRYYPQIEAWVVGGHSLGGAMAARFAHDHPDRVKGLVLWAAYPEESKNLSQQQIAVASVYGTLDGLATEETIERSRRLLPADTLWVPVEGGNHAQFGWYGAQAGDREALIPRAAQQDQAVAATLNVLERIQPESDP